MPLAPRLYADVMQDVVADVWLRFGELAVRTAVAIGIATIVLLLAAAFRPLIRRLLNRAERPSRTRVFTALYQLGAALIAVLLALTLAFPSVRVVDVLGSLGIISVAVGFAFKDVLENLLAGVLILLRDPFRSGDQIRVGEHQGRVEGITVRETLLKTFDGDLVLIPNARVYTSAVQVDTHYPTARIALRLKFPAHTDVAELSRVATPVLHDASTGENPPEIVVVGAHSGALEVEFRLWSGSTRAERTTTLSTAAAGLLAALEKAGIPLDEPRSILTIDMDPPEI
jgi:small conductance mechanosensitive channel